MKQGGCPLQNIICPCVCPILYNPILKHRASCVDLAEKTTKQTNAKQAKKMSEMQAACQNVGHVLNKALLAARDQDVSTRCLTHQHNMGLALSSLLHIATSCCTILEMTTDIICQSFYVCSDRWLPDCLTPRLAGSSAACLPFWLLASWLISRLSATPSSSSSCTLHCTLRTAHCILAHCTLAHCTLHTAHCTLRTAHCTLHCAQIGKAKTGV